jgi:hypothetical protein
MERVKKINVQGTMKSLDIGEKFLVSKKDHVPSYVRWVATKLKGDADMCFRVLVEGKNITVIRIK